jgi:Zn-dependent protease
LLGVFENLPLDLLRIFVLILCLTFHEASHAWAAYRLGDDTARRMGRLSLNPLVHLDFLGTLMILGGMPIGWAKPVPVDARNIRNPRSGLPLVAFAGPLSNLVMAFSGCVVYALVGERILDSGWYAMLLLFIRINFGLAIFNLLPIAPLDGSKIVTAFMPDSMADRFEATMARMGIFPLLIVVASGFFLPGPGLIGYWFHFWRPLIVPILGLFQVPAYLYPG